MLGPLSDCAPLLPQGLSSPTPPWSEDNSAAYAWARGDLSVVGSAWESPPPPLVDLGSISTPAALSAPATDDSDLYVIATTDASVVELGDRLRARGAHTLALKPGEGVADLVQRLEALRPAGGWERLHLLSHGRDGALQIGNQVLTSRNLWRQREPIQQLGRLLSSEGDLLIYGCELAASAAGERLVNKLSGQPLS